MDGFISSLVIGAGELLEEPPSSFETARLSSVLFLCTVRHVCISIEASGPAPVLGDLVTQPSFLKALGNPDPGYVGTIVAMYNVGCLIGCLVAALFGYRLGR